VPTVTSFSYWDTAALPLAVAYAGNGTMVVLAVLLRLRRRSRPREEDGGAVTRNARDDRDKPTCWGLDINALERQL
jgi:hypothetical protein